jgi:outer membrane protein assembly factor BamB
MTDADVIWRYDAFGELKAKPHDTNNCDIVYYDGLLVVNTGNSPDHTHVHVPNPEAPSLLIMDAEKGIPLARDNFDIGSDISHGQWCSPTFGRVNGKDMIFYGGGNGCLYAVEAPSREALWKQYDANGKKMIRLETAWKFQGDPRAHQPGGVVPPFVMGMNSPSYTCLPPPALDGKGRIFMLFGHDAWNGARPFRSWLACIDAATGKLIWGTGNIEGGAITPIAIDNGLVYIGDRRGNFYCFDAASGKEHWKLPLRGDMWARPLIAEGKIYVGTDRRMFYTLKAGLEPKILSEITMPDRIFAPAAVSGNTLYVAGDGFLYAVEGKASR